MRLHDLKLNNFRVYSGEHYFDLSPREKYGSERPIILFGGLNGAGKTSILSAIRLALYGRLALGSHISQKRYENYLLDSIHNPMNKPNGPKNASVEISFTYTKLGEESTYTVFRSWDKTTKSVKESLEITENNELVSGLTYDQAQTFLNELIPIGVSDLFFFDGEKIAKLAEDTGGEALENAVKKLLGLDLVERLVGDLSVLNRNLSKNSSELEVRKDIQRHEDELASIKSDLQKTASKISIAKAEEAEIDQQVRQLTDRLNSRGGHFVKTRKNIEARLESLVNEKQKIEANIHQFLASHAILSLAPEFTERMTRQLESDLDIQAKLLGQKEVYSAFDAFKSHIRESFDRATARKVSEEVDHMLLSVGEIECDSTVHDMTPSQAASVMRIFNDSHTQQSQLVNSFIELEKTESELDNLGISLSRAPDDSIVESDFENLQTKQNHLGRQQEKISQLRLEAKQKAKHALDVARRIDKLYINASRSQDQERVISYLANTKSLLVDFIHKISKKKVEDLEHQFKVCFSNLARKSDLKIGIKIDPIDFSVSLISEDGDLIDKDQLSAGEKQIFAIAVLESLAKTSGRQLPMIVDTPLGRLDSHHRKQLVDNYFPRASHQMIILSTDTEVDESFYKRLSKDISRAYLLSYDPRTSSTHAIESYFWRKTGVGA